MPIFLALSIMLLGCVLLTFFAVPIQAQLLVTEVFPNPDTPADATEWLEVYNYSETDLNLNEWTINNTLLPSLKLEPKQVAVLTKDVEKFLAVYNELEASDMLVKLPISLPNGGLEISLKKVDSGPEVPGHILKYANTDANVSWKLSGDNCNLLVKSAQHTLWKFDYQQECEATKLPKVLMINEIYPSPTYGGEWIEVRNISASKIDLGRNDVEVIVNGERLAVKEISSARIPPGQLATIELGSSNQLPDCGQPSSCSVDLEVFYQSNLQHSLQYDDTIAGYSLGLIEQVWLPKFQPTPGSNNILASATSEMRISEVYPSPQTSEDEWVEIQNNGKQAQSLWGWSISDTSKSMMLKNLTVPAGGFIQVIPTGVTLNNGGDSLQLKDFAGRVIHEFTYSDTDKGQGWGTNISGDILPVARPTPGAANSLQIQTTLKEEKPNKELAPIKNEKADVETSSTNSEAALAQLPSLNTWEPRLEYLATSERSYSDILKFNRTVLVRLGVRVFVALVLAILTCWELISPVKALLTKSWLWWHNGASPLPK